MKLHRSLIAGGAMAAVTSVQAGDKCGFEASPPKDLQAAALREAIATLSSAARAELYALMRMGQGHLAAKTWYQGVVDAEGLGDDTVTAEIAENPDLHDHIIKALYEAKLVSS